MSFSGAAKYRRKAMTSIEEYRARKARWVEALRSGRYMRCYNDDRQYLKYEFPKSRTWFSKARDEPNYSALGVACDVFDPTAWERKPGSYYDTFYYGDSTYQLTGIVQDHYGLKRPNGLCILAIRKHATPDAINLNLLMRYKSFSEIADIIDSEPEGLFTWTTP